MFSTVKISPSVQPSKATKRQSGGFDPLSIVLGTADKLWASYQKRLAGKSQPRFFPNGYGDIESFYKQQQTYLEKDYGKQEQEVQTFQLRNHDIDWASESTIVVDGSKEIVVREGYFDSPMSDQLPEESKRCRFHIVEPQQADEGGNKGNRKNTMYIVMIAGTGETSKSVRLQQATALASNHGYTSLILNSAFYGIRKPAHQKSFFFSEVVDLLKHMESVKQEGAVLAKWILNEYHPETSRVCFTGFSMGAGLACVCAAHCLRMGIEGKRLGVASFCPTSGSGALVSGLIRVLVDWDGDLNTDDQQNISSSEHTTNSTISNDSSEPVIAEVKKKIGRKERKRQAKAQLYEVLKQTSAFSLVGVPSPNGTGSGDHPVKTNHNRSDGLGVCTMAFMKNDRIITKEYRDDTIEFLRRFASPSSSGVEVDSLRGGHVAAAFKRQTAHIDLIERTCAKMLSLSL